MKSIQSSARQSAPKSARQSPQGLPLKSPRVLTIDFTRLYRQQERPRTKTDPKGRRLGALIKIFGLAPSALARAGGVSPAYLSRILNETDPFVGSADFYRRLESVLGKLIDQRQRQFFRFAPLPVRSVERAVREVLELAA